MIRFARITFKNYFKTRLLFKYKRPNPSQVIFLWLVTIFDWDDTLLPTSFLGRNGLLEYHRDTMDLLSPLDFTSCSLLEQSLKYGDTYLITNAAKGWIEHSAQRFLPKTYELLSQVTIVSARTEYEHLYPGKFIIF